MPSETPSRADRFLQVYDREVATTLKVLRAYPEDQLDLRPHEKCKTARELAWVFVLERGLGRMVYQDEFVDQAQEAPPEPPDSWAELLQALEEATAEFREMLAGTPDEELDRSVRFFTAPQTLGEISRIEWIWFLLHDEIHHRGQFSIYLRMAGGRVPSIYGPTADEPWT